MKKYSELQKIISIVMLFILMIEFTGCYSSKIIRTSEMSASDIYLIHGKSSTYAVENVVVSNEILSARLDLNRKNTGNGNKTHIYVSPDSAMKINNDLISIPVIYITKIEQKVPDPKKTRALTIVLIITACTGVGIALLAIGANSLFKALYTTPVETNSTGLCTNW